MSAPLPERAGPVWARFTADPRRNPDVRASDADRDIAAEAINAAFSDGRLDSLEHSDRLGAVLAAKRLGELTPLLDDIVVVGRPKPPTTAAAKARRVQDGAIRSWIGLAILFNVIWVATWLFSGDAPYYYWPIWPMIGTGIPVLLTWLGAGASARKHEGQPLEIEASDIEDRAGRRERRRERRQG